MPGSEGKVNRLVFLQAHIYITQLAADERFMPVNGYRQSLFGIMPGKNLVMGKIFKVPPRSFFEHRELISPRPYFTKQLSFHKPHSNQSDGRWL